MAASEKTSLIRLIRSRWDKRLLAWIPAVSPLALFVLGLIFLLASRHGSEIDYSSQDQTTLFTVCLTAMKSLFFFAFYLSVPLWCVLCVYPTFRPAEAALGWQICLFGAGWFAFFLFIGCSSRLCEHLLGIR